MKDIALVLKQKLAEITKNIEQLEHQRGAIETALRSLDGPPTRRTRGPAATRARRRRRKPGANQESVLSALSGKPQRLTDIASAAGLKLTAAASVLRTLITKGVATKGKDRGTYLKKDGAAAKTRAKRKPAKATRPRRPKKTAARSSDTAAPAAE